MKNAGEIRGSYICGYKKWEPTAKILDGAYERAIHNGKDVLVDIHLVTRRDCRYKVMRVAKFKEDRMYEYHSAMIGLCMNQIIYLKIRLP